MDDDTLNALLRSEDPNDIYHLDNQMLNSEEDQTGGKKKAAPRFFINAKQAVGILNGADIPNEDGDDEWLTSCEEEEEEEEDEWEEEEEDEDDDGEWARRRRRKKRTTRNRLCFGCSFSSSASNDNAVQASKINMLLRMHDDLFGRIDAKTLARMLHLYFMKEIREPLLQNGIVIPVWRTREIHEHFAQHLLDPRIMLGNQIQDYREISGALDRLAFERRETGSGVELNKDNLALKLRVDQHLLRLYSTDATKMNFYSPEVKVDFATVGARLNPLRNFSLQ